MKKFFFLVVATLSFVSCVSTAARTDISKLKFGIAMNERQIPFTLEYPGCENVPVVSLSVADGKRYYFIFDTGSNRNVFFQAGIEKMYGSLEAYHEQIYPVYLEYTKNTAEQNSVLQESRWKQDNNYKKLLRDGWFKINITNFKIGDFGVRDKTEFETESEVENYKRYLDGIVGVHIFSNAKNIVIDYRRLIIEIDAPLISNKSIPMEMNEALRMYTIPITINGSRDSALVDTGAEMLVLRNNYGRDPVNMPMGDIADYLMNGQRVKRTFPRAISISELRVGDISYSEIKGYYTSNMLVNASEFGKRMGYMYNFVGYPVFKDRRIQLDFEKMKFMID